MFAPKDQTAQTHQDLRAFVLQRLRAAMPEVAFKQRIGEPHRLTLLHPDAGDLVLNLGNLMQELQAVPSASAEALVDSFVSLAQRALAPPEIRLDRVFPGLRHRAFLDAAGQSFEDCMVGEAPGDMASVVIADQGDGVATLNEAAVKAAGLKSERVMLAAEQNFVELLPKAFRVGSPEEDVLSLGLRGYPWLGTSLLFVPLLISRVMEERGWDRALLAAPTRETVDLVNCDAPDAHEVMESWMSRRLAGPRTQSEMVFTFCADDNDYRRTHIMMGGRLVRPN